MYSEPASVSIEIPEPLVRLTDGAAAVQVEAGTAAAALEALWQRFPKLQSRVLDRHGRLYPYLLLLHNGRTVTHTELATHPLQPGDRIEIVALAEGG
ncbi:MAG TPA: MoaD/ThiS family protein [Planctomycetaceae bacterium]|nr:MoaD/ThiS family protein [Planctomycetaceae bacterium]